MLLVRRLLTTPGKMRGSPSVVGGEKTTDDERAGGPPPPNWAGSRAGGCGMPAEAVPTMPVRSCVEADGCIRAAWAGNMGTVLAGGIADDGRCGKCETPSAVGFVAEGLVTIEMEGEVGAGWFAL